MKCSWPLAGWAEATPGAITSVPAVITVPIAAPMVLLMFTVLPFGWMLVELLMRMVSVLMSRRPGSVVPIQAFTPGCRANSSDLCPPGLSGRLPVEFVSVLRGWLDIEPDTDDSDQASRYTSPMMPMLTGLPS